MHTFPHGFNSHTGTHSQYSCMHTRTHFGPISLQLLIAVVHLLYDEVGSRVLSQVVVVVYHPAPLGVPLLLPVHAQQQGRLVIRPVYTVHGDVVATYLLNARGAHAVAPRALAHDVPRLFCDLTLALPAHQLPGLMDLWRNKQIKKIIRWKFIKY